LTEPLEVALEAQQAGIDAARPGVQMRAIHDAAIAVIARKLDEWGILPVSAAEALSPEGGQHRRWMVHGTSHHLGLDVHDCAQARNEHYREGVLEAGMVVTVEPGLYFKWTDVLVPPELRGSGIRIEDDIAITADGCEILSSQLPRDPDAVEAWIDRIWTAS
jgi:Xaa-Pro aminopeptidase